MKKLFSRIAFIGAGLMNTSIALRAMEKDAAETSILYDVNQKAISDLTSVLSSHSRMRATDNLQEAVSGADLVVLGTPIDVFGSVTRQMAPYIKEDAIITHIGSVMGHTSCEVRDALPVHLKGRFLASHPATGSAESGPLAANVKMMDGANLVISSEEVDFGVSKRLEMFWRRLDSQVIRREPEIHDREFAAISHHQHLRAFSLARLGKGKNGYSLLDDYRNGGNLLRDATRVARANTAMWLPIFKHNRQAILETAAAFNQTWHSFEAILREGKVDDLYTQIRQAHDFAEPLHRAMPHERLMSDIHDYEADNRKVKDVFAERSFARRVCFPAFLGVVTALNVKDTEKCLGTRIEETVNPSLLDAIRPVLAHAGMLCTLLYENRDHVLIQAADYKAILDRAVQAVDENDEKYLHDFMAESHAVRGAMPPFRRMGTDTPLRTEYLAGDNAESFPQKMAL